MADADAYRHSSACSISVFGNSSSERHIPTASRTPFIVIKSSSIHAIHARAKRGHSHLIIRHWAFAKYAIALTLVLTPVGFLTNEGCHYVHSYFQPSQKFIRQPGAGRCDPVFRGPCLAAQQIAVNDATTGEPLETVVVTGTAQFNTDAAPAKSSLTTMEPETIINKSYIENFVAPQADYVTILSIVPSMTGGDPNGPGLSDGGAKNTLRGLPDGNFAMQYDDIPFGDTNGPTHHNISYFPATTIGSINVDRGPGNAGNLGANTYGGTVKLFSETLGDDPIAKGFASYGSFDDLDRQRQRAKRRIRSGRHPGQGPVQCAAHGIPRRAEFTESGHNQRAGEGRRIRSRPTGPSRCSPITPT